MEIKEYSEDELQSLDIDRMVKGWPSILDLVTKWLCFLSSSNF